MEQLLLDHLFSMFIETVKFFNSLTQQDVFLLNIQTYSCTRHCLAHL